MTKTNDLLKISQTFKSGFYEITNKKGEVFDCKTRLDGGDLTSLLAVHYGNRLRYNLLTLQIEIDNNL